MRAIIEKKMQTRPKSVTILGMGRSVAEYAHIFRGNVGKPSDEVWGINHSGLAFRTDKIFLMDDIKAMEDEKPVTDKRYGNLPPRLTYTQNIQKLDIPVITCRADEDYPCTVSYPLQEVVDYLQQDNFFNYFNNTISYAIAYAIYTDVQSINIWGADFSYPPEERCGHYVEAGRACLEFWSGFALARGIDIIFPKHTHLFDAASRKFYGFLQQPDVVPATVSEQRKSHNASQGNNSIA